MGHARLDLDRTNSIYIRVPTLWSKSCLVQVSREEDKTMVISGDSPDSAARPGRVEAAKTPSVHIWHESTSPSPP